MDIDASASKSFTILRIKRKRNEEPLDALVVERSARRKKSRGGVGVFQYAQTVEDGAWKDEKSQKDIQDRISRLASENAVRSQGMVVTPHEELGALASPIRIKKEQTPRYTIISPENEVRVKRRATSPPKTRRSKDPASYLTVPDFRMYDAVLAEHKSIEATSEDPEMEKFLPLLNDYLKIHDIPIHATPNTLLPVPRTKNGKKEPINDYVWDVFYHRPASSSEWKSLAARTGTLTGSVLDSDDSDSEIEAEDEADEDSNAEEYYKNDYPDEESESESENSDEFHEQSDYDD